MDSLRKPIQVLREKAWVRGERALEAGKQELRVPGIPKMDKRQEGTFLSL